MGWGRRGEWRRYQQQWLERVKAEGWDKDWGKPRRFGGRRWGLRRRLTTWFLIVSLGSVALTTWITTAAVYKAQLELAKAFPEVVGVELPHSFWDRPQFLVNDPRYRAAGEAFRNVTRTALLAGIGAFFLSGIAAAVVTRRLTKPLIALEEAANRLERGERDVRLRVPEAKDELRTVTESFNRLVNGLERQESWRKRVVADIAHDLRTPLSVMRSEIEAMQDGVRPMDNDSLERLLAEIALLSKMIEDLRALERAEGAFRLDLHEIALEPFLRDVVGGFQTRAERAGVGVHLEPVQTGLRLRADATQLMRLLNNLLENALEHSGGNRITVSAVPEGEETVIRVRDNGRGIRDPERIFERFYRGDDSRTRDPDGQAHSGLGLSIARAIAVAHGGTLEAVNTGDGASFALRLPVPLDA
jgi:two-component system, OmpR family, sensor histidine kinase BaeS